MKTVFGAALCAGLMFVAAPSATASTIAFHVQVNTAPLVGSGAPPAPFALDFQLNGGSPLGNTATISLFNFGGGAPTASPSGTVGLASGSLASTVTVSDDSTHPFNEFFQGFTPGATLGFDVLLTTNANAPTPDEFSFSILDSSLGFPAQIFTTAPDTLSLLVVDITSSSLGLGDVRTFASTSPSIGGVTVAATPVPEPATLSLFCVGLAVIAARRWRQ